MKKWFVLLLLALLSACATVKKIESGPQRIGDRLTIDIQGNWNHFEIPGLKPGQVWTMEGITIDEFVLYSGVKDGETMHPVAPKDERKSVLFRAAMTRDELLSMFEAMLSRDGSTFKTLKAEPYPFGGRKGVRFEFERIRKVDHLVQRGVAFAAVDRGELFALLYTAPRLTFYPRHKDRVEAIARSARIS